MFLDSVKSSQTRRKYKNALNEFLKLVPSKIYQEELNTIPQDREPKTLAKFFVDLTRKNPDLVTRILIQFVKQEVEQVQSGKLSPNTLPNHVKPVKALLESNRIHTCFIFKGFLMPRNFPKNRLAINLSCSKDTVYRWS